MKSIRYAYGPGCDVEKQPNSIRGCVGVRVLVVSRGALI